jgi:hypothetical protein
MNDNWMAKAVASNALSGIRNHAFRDRWCNCFWYEEEVEENIHWCFMGITAHISQEQLVILVVNLVILLV